MAAMCVARDSQSRFLATNHGSRGVGAPTPAGRLSTPPDFGFRVWALKDSRAERFTTKHTRFRGGNVRCAGIAEQVLSCKSWFNRGRCADTRGPTKYSSRFWIQGLGSEGQPIRKVCYEKYLFPWRQCAMRGIRRAGSELQNMV